MQFGLKVLSGVCLLFVGISFLPFVFSLMLGGGDIYHALIVTAFAFPVVVAFVASYRQFFKPQRGLIITLVVLIFVQAISLIYTLESTQKAVIEFNQMIGSDAPELLMDDVSIGDILVTTGLLLIAMLIPVYVNFRARQN